MKQTILVCDWCPGVVKQLAIAQLTLVNGRGTSGALAVDLCAKHQREAKKLCFRPKRGRPSKHEPTTSKSEKGAAMRAKLVALAEKPLLMREFAKRAGINKQLTYYYLKDLVSSGKLKKQGKGVATRYVQA